MQEAKKKSGLNDQEEPKKKERHIVSWTPQEDDILRQQISLHGTENWAIIASKFKDKTTRQCRRRWYTYLNSDFKKGGWSPEEDMLLCEAQRIFGNRWTEIAKVVSGRTDNAVKNRFNTLCKKRAKYEALAKEKENNFSKPSNKRPIFHIPEDAAPAKKIRRSPVPDHTETCNFRDRSHPQYGSQQQRPPFAVLAQNIRNVNMVAQNTISNVDTSAKEVSVDAAQNKKTEGTFLKKDDLKITALMQQAELLSSLAMKVDNEKTEQSLENAWKILQDFLTRSKEKNTSCPSKLPDVDFQLEDVKDLIEELRSVNEGSQLPWRQPDPYEESPASSEYSTGSHVMAYIAPEKIETQAENNALCNELATEMQSIQIEENNVMGDCKMDIISSPNDTQVGVLQSSDVQIHNDMLFSAIGSTEFSSPLQVTPIFRSLAAGIPSPKFSESERSFLLKTLGMESPCPHPSTNPSQPPSCRRALLQSL